MTLSSIVSPRAAEALYPAVPRASVHAASDIAPPASPEARFAAFAFAAAELLVETRMDGTILYAAGAFRQRFGRDGIFFIGRHVAALVAAGDQSAFGLALAALPLSGRMAPLELRTSDVAASPCAVAAMLMPGALPRICFTFGAVPLRAGPGAADGLVDAVRFAGEAEAVLAAGGTAALTLLELAPDGRPATLAAVRRGLADGARATPGLLAAELAEGCFGLLSPAAPAPAPALARLLARMQLVVGDDPGALRGLDFDLGAGELARPQAARALRLLLSRFAAGGTAAATLVGAAAGLRGIVARIGLQAAAMRSVLEDGRFGLDFQPVMHLGGSPPAAHHEALLRPAPGPAGPPHAALHAALQAALSGPRDFVDSAQALGLSAALDLAVLRQALAALHDRPDLSLAVNICGLSMDDPGFRQELLATVQAHRAAAGPRDGGLLLELTDTVEIGDIAGAAETVAALRRAEVRVGLDDFGAGATSFRMLEAFEIDFVKIDGAYVRAALESERERGAVAALVELAGSVGAQAVAETIETPAQAELMRQLGVQLGQGWLFGRPGALPPAG